MSAISEATGLIFGGNAELIEIVLLSLRVSLSATAIAAFFAIPLGALIAKRDFPGKRLVLVFSTSFMALPPVVVGLLVYVMLSRAGPLGEYGLLFTPSAMVIAQTILIFPIILALTNEAINPVARDYARLFDAMGTPGGRRMMTLIVDARFAIATALLAGFGRALAEVGAVIIVGGNIAGVTRVMTTTIALETSKGNLELALALGIILIVIALLVNWLMHLISNIGQRYQVRR